MSSTKRFERAAAERLAALVEEALPVFQSADHHLALFTAYDALVFVAQHRGLMDAALEPTERAAAHARPAGRLPQDVLAHGAGCRFNGTTPVSELLAWLDEPEQRAGRSYWLNDHRAGALAMLGRFDEARALLAEIRTDLAYADGVPWVTSATPRITIPSPAVAVALGRLPWSVSMPTATAGTRSVQEKKYV